PTAAIYSVGVTRDPVTQRITGFAGSATFYADAPYLDGGLAFGPGGVLFYATYEGGVVGQIKPGSTSPDKTTLTSSIGLGGNGGGLQFVPDGFAGAGQLKLYRYSTGIWRTVPFTPDEYGTYELGTA